MCGIALLLQLAQQKCDFKNLCSEVEAKIEQLKLLENEDQNKVEVSSEEILKSMENKIKYRGPDQQNTGTVDIFGSKLSICGSLLALRGEKPQPQPLRDENLENILVWNGEVFGGTLYEKVWMKSLYSSNLLMFKTDRKIERKR